MCSKVGEESQEVIEAAQHGTQQSLVGESVDLIYHLLVVLAEKNIEWEDVLKEIQERRKK
jgi:phosphoribosyl-ATP pyrophosphohydrolase